MKIIKFLSEKENVKTISYIMACTPFVILACGIIEGILFNSGYILLALVSIIIISGLIPIMYIVIRDISYEIEKRLNEKIDIYNYNRHKNEH